VAVVNEKHVYRHRALPFAGHETGTLLPSPQAILRCCSVKVGYEARNKSVAYLCIHVPYMVLESLAREPPITYMLPVDPEPDLRLPTGFQNYGKTQRATCITGSLHAACRLQVADV